MSIFPTHPRLRGLVARVAARDQLGSGAPPCQGPAGDRTVVQGRVSGPLRWSVASRPRPRSCTGGPHAAPFLGVWGLLTGVGSPLKCVRAAGRGARSRVDVARWRHMPAVRTSRHALAFAGSSDWARAAVAASQCVPRTAVARTGRVRMPHRLLDRPRPGPPMRLSGDESRPRSETSPLPRRVS